MRRRNAARTVFFVQEASNQAGCSNLTLVVVLVIFWLVWLGIYFYTAVYVPRWQREQAHLVESALYRDCRISLPVSPASVPMTERPVWSRTYPPTGRELLCQIDTQTREWHCTDCAGGP